MSKQSYIKANKCSQHSISHHQIGQEDTLVTKYLIRKPMKNGNMDDSISKLFYRWVFVQGKGKYGRTPIQEYVELLDGQNGKNIWKEGIDLIKYRIRDESGYQQQVGKTSYGCDTNDNQFQNMDKQEWKRKGSLKEFQMRNSTKISGYNQKSKAGDIKFNHQRRREPIIYQQMIWKLVTCNATKSLGKLLEYFYARYNQKEVPTISEDWSKFISNI